MGESEKEKSPRGTVAAIVKRFQAAMSESLPALTAEELDALVKAGCVGPKTAAAMRRRWEASNG